MGHSATVRQGYGLAGKFPGDAERAGMDKILCVRPMHEMVLVGPMVQTGEKGKEESEAK